jgi:predicted nucleic acid-binding protein
MIAFDSDVLSELFRGSADYIRRAELVPAEQHAIPVVVVEEMLRGRLSEIRRAEAGRSQIGIERAYDLLQETVRHIQHLRVLPYASDAERLYAAAVLKCPVRSGLFSLKSQRHTDK